MPGTGKKQRLWFYFGKHTLHFVLLLFNLYWMTAYNKSMFLPRQNYQLAEDLGRAFSDRAVLHTFLDAEATVTSGPLKVLANVVHIIFIVIGHNYLTKRARCSWQSRETSSMLNENTIIEFSNVVCTISKPCRVQRALSCRTFWVLSDRCIPWSP